MNERAVDAPPARGKRSFTLAQKIGMAMGILLLAMSAMGGIMFVSMREVDKSVDALARSTIPASNAAYEMEINVGEIGVKTLRYLDSADTWARLDAVKDMDDFHRFHQRYLQAVRTDIEREIGSKTAATFADYRAACLRAMDVAEEQRAEFASLNARTAGNRGPD